MKTFRTLLVITIAVFGFSATSFGQSTATATSTATLITPISITKTADLLFGTIASSNTAGTVTIDYDDTPAADGGVTLMSGGVTRTSAKFTVSGEGTSAISISCPTSTTLTKSGGGTLTVDNISADSGSSANLSGGTLPIKVKGTLNVPANTVAGVYTNTTAFTITVNYQ